MSGPPTTVGATPPPTGVVTFCFTDVVGSTALWDRAAAPMAEAMVRHDEIVEQAVATHGGLLVRPRGEGDSRFAVFTLASDALAGALAIRDGLAAERWSTPRPIQVRIALLTGEADFRAGDYYGTSVNRCARLRATGHPGQIVVAEATAALAGDHVPAGAVLLDLGVHRLADLARPEHVFQLGSSDERYPPLRSLDQARHNLRVQPTALVGRDAAVEAVIDALGRSRIVTVLGPGGAGKTRLALQVAAEMANRLPEGAWVVELASISDAALVDSAVAASLGVAEIAGVSVAEAVAAHLQGRELLLVLDNCEHLVAAAAVTAAGLIAAAPGLRVLATSREPLVVAGETLYPLALLAVPPAPSGTFGAADALAFDSVRLFVDRATAASPSFSLTDANAATVARVCARLDGIPLAIELAAARCRALSVEQIALRLDDRFRLLTGGDRAGLPHHQTLRATVAWSHQLLAGDEQAVFARLAVFAGGASAEGVEAVVAGDGIDVLDAVDVVCALVDRSLVVADDPHDGGSVRYRMLDTMREFAAEQLVARGEDGHYRRRHAEWCLRLAKSAEGATHGPDEVAVFRALDADHDNLRAALAWATGAGEHDLVARLCLALAPYWVARGQLTEGGRWLPAVLESDARSRHPRLLFQAGMLAAKLDDYATARAHLESALSLFEQSGDAGGASDCLSYLGSVAVLVGDLEAASNLAAEALARAASRRTGEDVRYLRYLLGWIAEERGDLAEARSRFEEHLAANVAAGSDVDAAHTRVTLAELALLEGRPQEAEALVAAARVVADRTEDAELTGYIERIAGMLALQAGDAVRAAEAFGAARDQAARAGRRLDLVCCLNGLGAANALAGNLVAARTVFAEAARMRAATGAAEPRAEAACFGPFRRLAGEPGASPGTQGREA